MTRAGHVASRPISKSLSADLMSITGPTRTLGAALCQAWKWLTRNGRGVLTRGVSRRLRVAETVSLGEKRFVSILQVDGEQFLLGGSPSNITLLARLESKPEIPGRDSFESIFSRAWSDVGGVESDSIGSPGVTR